MSLNYNGVTYRVADAHAHIYPDKIAEKATASVGTFYNVEMENRVGTTAHLLENGSAYGVEKYLVSSVATKLEQVRSISTFLAGECEKHPEFIGLGAWHEDVTDIAGEFDNIEALGLRGIKLHPDFQKFNIDDEKMLPVYAEAAKRGLVVLFHMGDYRTEYSKPIRLVNVLNRIPNLHCIGAHLGGYTDWEEGQHVLAGRDWPNFYVDCSSSFGFLGPEKAAEYIRGFGTQRVMFGTDFPMWKTGRELEQFFAMGFSEAENRAMLWDNFANLFSL